MYTIDHCLACKSLDLEIKEPAFIHQFVAWRSKGEFVWDNTPTKTLICKKCGFTGPALRLGDEEESRYYQGHKGKDYTDMRIFSQPWYIDMLKELDSFESIQNRKNNIDSVVGKYVNIAEINSVLEFGLTQGQYIPKKFLKSKNYFYNVGGYSPGTMGVHKFDSRIQKIKFDFVSCLNYLEVVSNLDGAIQSIKSLLRDNGWIYFELPSNRYDVDVYQEQVNFFTESSIRIILERLGFDVIDISLNKMDFCVLGKKK
jgi:SAM-dependent methyltransferase